MSAPRPRRGRERRAAAGLVLALAGLLPACAEVDSAAVDGYHPSTVEEVAGSDVKRVTLTREGARRTGLRTAAVRTRGEHRVVPYEALIYDANGTPFVYTSTAPLTFVRADVTVDRVAGGRVLLTDGPRPGTRVVTVGATEVYGTELGIEGGH